MVLGLFVVLIVSATVKWWADTPLVDSQARNRYPFVWGNKAATNSLGYLVDVNYFWDRERALAKFNISGAEHRNIRPQDYVGPDSCRECHPEQYATWSDHAHRRMNQMANTETVLGDFGNSTPIRYLGGKARFYRQDEEFRMDLWRDGETNRFVVERTIGSRFSQTYTGRLVGQSKTDALKEVILPFTWWLEAREWTPTTHVFAEVDSDEHIWDPYDEPFSVSYDVGCAECHTTIPYGEVLLRSSGYSFVREYVPRSFHFAFSNMLSQAPVFDSRPVDSENESLKIMSSLARVSEYSTREHAAALGISCEACHFGMREHVENSTRTESEVLPRFFPSDPDLFVDAANEREAYGRTSMNKNFMCGRCHVGGRPEFASGHHTWNSTEYSDAVAGYCYVSAKKPEHPTRSLTCVQCHDPHVGIGKKWSRTRAEDNHSCVDCHEAFKEEAALSAHTHHDPGSVGSDCMNCHMPKINEGLQDMVRTHRIFSPTEASLIETNQPNACNMCHVEKGINWTLEKLGEWYDAEFDQEKIAAAYPNRDKPVALNWLMSEHSATRMVAADALTTARATWALPRLVENLNDTHMTNRQFLQRWLEKWLELDFRELGYRSYQTPEERKAPLEAIRKELSDSSKLKTASAQ